MSEPLCGNLVAEWRKPFSDKDSELLGKKIIIKAFSRLRVSEERRAGRSRFPACGRLPGKSCRWNLTIGSKKTFNKC